MPERLQRLLLFMLILYITFIGGTGTPELYLGHRVFFQVVMALLLAFWGIRMLIQRRSPPQTPLDLLIILTALWFAVTTLFSHDWRMSFEMMWTYLLHIVLFYLMVDIVRAGRQRWLFEALFIAGGLIVMVSVLELVGWYFGLGFADFKQGWFEIGGLGDPIPPTIERLHLAFGYSTILSNYIVMLVPVILAWGLTIQQRDLRISLFILLGGLLGVQVLTFSRGGLIGTAVGLGMMALFWLQRSSDLRHKIRLQLLIPIFMVGLLIFGLLIMVFSSQDDRDLGDRGRADMWTSAVEMIKDRPLTGFGLREFGVVFREYRDPSIVQDKLAAAHNLWLNTGAELGIPGLILLVGIGFVFLRVWLAEWGEASGAQQIRLEGLLAALAGFAIHSMVDTFTLTASVLPILIYGAYVFETRKDTFKPLSKWSPVPIMIISVVIYCGGFLKINLAQYSMSLSIHAIEDDDLPNALHYANRARELDPQLGLYDLHYAYVLGLLADDNPSEYLDTAINAHQAALEHDPTFDLFHVNLAALYLQRGENGDYEQAVEHLQQAVDLNRRQQDHQLLLGVAFEQQAIAEGFDPSSDRIMGIYYGGIQGYLFVTGSGFWEAAPPFTGRVEALERYYQNTTPAERLMIATQRGWVERAEREFPLVEGETTDLAFIAVGDYGLYMIGDDEMAIEAYSQVIEAGNLSTEDVAPIYAKRGEAYFQLGDYDEAERDARTALFLDATTGARGNYVLALLEIAQRHPPLDDEKVNQLLVDSIVPRTVVQYYASVVYLRPAAFDYLPQVQLIGFSRQTYDPWLLLAERYATDNNPNTDPQTVYDALHREAPYLQIP